MPASLLRFGGFELDPASFQLRRSGRPLHLERIPLEILLLLVERRGQLVRRHEIADRIWGTDVVLDIDNALNTAIRKIRRVLRDDPARARYVETVPARGYRFIGAVVAAAPPEVGGSAEHDRGQSISTPAVSVTASGEVQIPERLVEKTPVVTTALEGERKHVTVLFAHIEGIQGLLADRDPEEARTLLDPVIESMMEAVRLYEGTVSQVMGDGIMALFGAPLAHEDHAVRACYAALRMRELLMPHLKGGGRPEHVRMHVGLDSGEVVVRDIASDLHRHYTAVGQTVHFAARMAQLAAPGSVVATAATLRLAAGYVHVKPLAPLAVNDVGPPLDAYEVTEPGEVRSRLQTAAARGFSPFVGREAELALLHRALSQARLGQGQVAAIVGEPGVGKSRLVFELVRTARDDGWLVLEARPVSYGKATSYLPVIGLLKDYFRIADRDTQRDILDKVTEKVLGLDPALEPTRPALLALLDVPFADPRWQGLDPSQRRQRTLDAVTRLLVRETQGQPVLAVFEDLHWIDTETQALLDRLVESLPTAPLLLLVDYRPESQHPWGSKMYYTQLRLDPLSPESALALLDTLLGPDASLESFKTLLVGKTERNPLFLEESVRTLIESQVLLGEPGAYHLAQPVDTVQVPATVQTTLAWRIDRLPPNEKRLLETAAVIGKDVPLDLLQAVAEESEETLHRQLGHLQTAEVLYETRLSPDHGFTFKHTLTHEVTYGHLLKDRRRTLHARIVDAIETLHRDRLGEHIERLAHHALRGELWEKAVAYLRQAGLRAMARAANREAIGHLEEALGALRRLPETRETTEPTIDIHFDLRNALNPLADRARMGEHLHEAEGLARTLGDQRRVGRVAIFMVSQCMVTGDYDEAVRFGQEALNIGRTLGDRSIEVEATVNLGLMHAARGEFSDAATFLERNVVTLEGDLRYERFGGSFIQSAVSGAYLAGVLAQLGRFDEAIGHAEAAVRIAEVADHPFTLYSGLLELGLAHLRRGDLPHATRVLERDLDLCRTWQFVARRSVVAAALGAAYTLAGRADEALPLVAGAVEEFRRRPENISPALILLCAGTTCLRAGRIDEAASHAREALALTRRLGARGSEAHALCLAGDVTSTGGVEDAEGYYRAALALADELGMRPLVAHCHLGLGRLYRRTGKREQTQEHLTTATTMYREMGMTYWLEQADVAMREFGWTASCR